MALTPLVARVVDAVDAHVHYDAAGLEPGRLDHFGAAHGRHDDVGAPDGGLDVLGAAVRDGDCGVALHEQQRHGDAHDVAAAQYHCVLALDGHARAVQQLDAALRRARHVEVDGVEGEGVATLGRVRLGIKARSKDEVRGGL